MILVFWHDTIAIDDIAINLLDIAGMVFTEDDIIKCILHIKYILHTIIVEVVFLGIDIEADEPARSAFLFGSS